MQTETSLEEDKTYLEKHVDTYKRRLYLITDKDVADSLGLILDQLLDLSALIGRKQQTVKLYKEFNERLEEFKRTSTP